MLNLLPKENSLYYALGAIKNVGFEAISQVVKERQINGEYKSISDFINRVDPKNINKLQLEGLVKAGAFDLIFNDRKTLFDNIPNIIQNSKTIYENKLNNQTSLFSDDSSKISYLMNEKNLETWSSNETLSKEFESVGFFISDHPLKYYQDILDQYKVKSFLDFEENNIKDCVLSGTIMSIKEKKTCKRKFFCNYKV